MAQNVAGHLLNVRKRSGGVDGRKSEQHIRYKILLLGRVFFKCNPILGNDRDPAAKGVLVSINKYSGIRRTISNPCMFHQDICCHLSAYLFQRRVIHSF